MIEQMIRIFTMVSATILLCSAAQAQRFNDVAQQLDMPARVGMPSSDLGVPIRIQVSYQLQIPFDRSGSIDDQKAAITASHVVLYDLAAHECQALQAVFAGDCRMISLSLANMTQPYYNGGTTLPVSANATFEIVQRGVVKPSAPKP